MNNLRGNYLGSHQDEFKVQCSFAFQSGHFCGYLLDFGAKIFCLLHIGAESFICRLIATLWNYNMHARIANLDQFWSSNRNTLVAQFTTFGDLENLGSQHLAASNLQFACYLLHVKTCSHCCRKLFFLVDRTIAAAYWQYLAIEFLFNAPCCSIAIVRLLDGNPVKPLHIILIVPSRKVLIPSP